MQDLYSVLLLLGSPREMRDRRGHHIATPSSRHEPPGCNCNGDSWFTFVLEARMTVIVRSDFSNKSGKEQAYWKNKIGE
jgi:hypothetical protein